MAIRIGKFQIIIGVGFISITGENSVLEFNTWSGIWYTENFLESVPRKIC